MILKGSQQERGKIRAAQAGAAEVSATFEVSDHSGPGPAGFPPDFQPIAKDPERPMPVGEGEVGAVHRLVEQLAIRPAE